MNFFNVLIPILLLFLLIYCAYKKVNVYDTFVQGAKTGLDLTISIFPYIATIILMVCLFEASGLNGLIIKILSPIFNFFGVPKELINLIILKPFSGSGSLALLNEIISNYGTHSYVTLCAAAIFGSSETVFYISAVYFVKCKNKKAVKPIIISLTACLISTILTCLICKFFI
ncbi:MAG: spore maturation protein [Clostridia bacterium]|nr:spore maturation protein [Clostridia bacterium]